MIRPGGSGMYDPADKMTKRELSRADVLGYFTGSPTQKRDPVLQDVEKIELYKFLKDRVPEEQKRDLVTLIERMCELPSHAYAKEMAREFNCGGFFACLKVSQGSSCLATLGFGPESRWDSIPGRRPTLGMRTLRTESK